jgi:hypothetical protein
MDNSHPLHSHSLAWRQAAQRSPLFHSTVNRGPRVVVQYIAFNIRLLLTRYIQKALELFLSFVSQTSVPPNEHVNYMSKFCKLSGPMRSDMRQLSDKIIIPKTALKTRSLCLHLRHARTHAHTPRPINNKQKCFADLQLYSRDMLSLFHIKMFCSFATFIHETCCHFST